MFTVNMASSLLQDQWLACGPLLTAPVSPQTVSISPVGSLVDATHSSFVIISSCGSSQLKYLTLGMSGVLQEDLGDWSSNTTQGTFGWLWEDQVLVEQTFFYYESETKMLAEA